jgi:hypothetical protein
MFREIDPHQDTKVTAKATPPNDVRSAVGLLFGMKFTGVSTAFSTRQRALHFYPNFYGRFFRTMATKINSHGQNQYTHHLFERIPN